MTALTQMMKLCTQVGQRALDQEKRHYARHVGPIIAENARDQNH